MYKCWRCGRRIKNVHWLCLPCGLKVAVCPDDRTCWSWAQKAKTHKKGDKK